MYLQITFGIKSKFEKVVVVEFLIGRFDEK